MLLAGLPSGGSTAAALKSTRLHANAGLCSARLFSLVQSDIPSAAICIARRLAL